MSEREDLGDDVRRGWYRLRAATRPTLHLWASELSLGAEVRGGLETSDDFESITMLPEEGVLRATGACSVAFSIERDTWGRPHVQMQGVGGARVRVLLDRRTP